MRAGIAASSFAVAAVTGRALCSASSRESALPRRRTRFVEAEGIRFASNMKNAKLILYPDYAHGFLVHYPEAFANVVVDFLDRWN